jgi:hypothetical protein
MEILSDVKMLVIVGRGKCLVWGYICLFISGEKRTLIVFKIVDAFVAL